VMWLYILVGPCWCVYVPNSATYTHQQGPTNTWSHITTHRCILIGCFNKCNFSKHEWCAPWWWCDCYETCRSCFNVNFSVNFKIVFRTIHLCINWWIKKTLITKTCVAKHLDDLCSADDDDDDSNNNLDNPNIFAILTDISFTFG